MLGHGPGFFLVGGSHDSSSRSCLHDVAPVSIRIRTLPNINNVVIRECGALYASSGSVEKPPGS